MARPKATKTPAKKTTKKATSTVKSTKAAKTTKAAKAVKTTKAKTAATKTSKPAKLPAGKLTKSQIITLLSERTELDKKTVKLFFAELQSMIEASIAPKGVGVITLPIGIKIKRHERPAQKARLGRNPLTGEEVMIKAKPKRKVVKVQAMKVLKEILA